MSAGKGKRCEKQPFPTLAAAELALLDCRIRRVLRGHTHRKESRAYVCRDCGTWHLTSKAGRHGERGAA